MCGGGGGGGARNQTERMRVRSIPGEDAIHK